MKQFPKLKSSSGIDQSAKAELDFMLKLFPRDNHSLGNSLDPQKYPGIKSITKLMDVVEDSKDLWLIYELGGQSMSKLLFDVKGEFHKGERIYHVQHMKMYQALKSNLDVLK